MEQPKRSEQALSVADVEGFVWGFERAVSSNGEYSAHAAFLERYITEDVFEEPPKVIPLYTRLAASDLTFVRELAADQIDRVFKVDPEAGAEIWNRLLNDEDSLIAQTAFDIFDSFCEGIEEGDQHNWDDLGPIYRSEEANVRASLEQNGNDPDISAP
jgi:hypothetical protein